MQICHADLQIRLSVRITAKWFCVVAASIRLSKTDAHMISLH
jgi:hypothetical protein